MDKLEGGKQGSCLVRSIVTIISVSLFIRSVIMFLFFFLNRSILLLLMKSYEDDTWIYPIEELLKFIIGDYLPLWAQLGALAFSV